MSDPVIQDPATAPSDPMPVDPEPVVRTPDELMNDPAELPKLIEQAEANEQNREEAKAQADAETVPPEADAKSPETTAKPSKPAKVKKMDLTPQYEVLDDAMLKELTSTFRIHVKDIRNLRFTEDNVTVYQLDMKGRGIYELRMVEG